MPEATFLRKFIMLSSGTVIGQGLIVASSPLLTRFFTPTEFGLFAVFSALAGIAGVASALRFEFSIPIAPDDTDAAALVKVTMLAAAVMAALLTLVVHWFGAWFMTLLEAPALTPWLWLLPGSALVWGTGSALAHWSTRHSRFGINALTQTLQLGSQAIGQIALGLAGTGASGLIIGYFVGYAVRTAHQMIRLPRAEWRAITGQPLARVWRNASREWRYPAMVFPSSFLQSICQLAPAILIAALYGPAMAGLFALSQRIVGLPVRLFSEAASQVLLSELRGKRDAALHRLFLRTLALFSTLGIAGTVPLLLFGPALFALIFGEPWREAGVIVQLLLPLHVARFVVLPISQILYSLNRQDIHLFSSVGNMVALIGSFGAAHVLGLDAETTILVYSITAGSSFVFYLASTWLLTRNVRALG